MIIHRQMGGILAPRLGRCLRGKADPAHKKRAVRSFRLLPRATSGVQARASRLSLLAPRVISPLASEPTRELAVLLRHLPLCAPSSVFQGDGVACLALLASSALGCDERSPVR